MLDLQGTSFRPSRPVHIDGLGHEQATRTKKSCCISQRTSCVLARGRLLVLAGRAPDILGRVV